MATAAVSPRERADVVIVGAGIVGLATALRLLEARPGLRITVLEKEAAVGLHQTGHNSGVLHAGLYYEPGSLKARLCQEGKADLEAYCEVHGIPVSRNGKLVIATDERELERLAALRTRALENGVAGLEEVGPERIVEIEPHAVGLRALWSPNTAVVDFAEVARAFVADIVGRGASIQTDCTVRSISHVGADLVLGTSRGDVVAGSVISCAGLQADRVAAMGPDEAVEDEVATPGIVPFRGDFYTLKPEVAHLVRGNIYPVPDPRFPFLGLHLTRRIDGSVVAGPNAVLATAREGYSRTDISLPDLREAIGHRGFRNLARRHWRVGIREMWRDWSRREFASGLRRYVPALQPGHLEFGPSGVRAQAIHADGSLVDDFVFGGSGQVLHLYNAPSPAATSSLAIGRVLASEAIGRFGLSASTKGQTSKRRSKAESV